MSRKSNLDKFRDVLFSDISENETLLPVERDQLKRYRATFHLSLENPSMPDTKLRDFLIKEFAISETRLTAISETSGFCLEMFATPEKNGFVTW